MQVNEDTHVVNSEGAYKDFCSRLWSQWEAQKYLIISVASGLTRTQEQNSKLWPMLMDISKQVTWYGKKYSKDDWKTIITGSYAKRDFVPNVDGTGFVVLGMSTSKMNRRVFADLILFMEAFGETQGVVWSEKSVEVMVESKAV